MAVVDVPRPSFIDDIPNGSLVTVPGQSDSWSLKTDRGVFQIGDYRPSNVNGPLAVHGSSMHITVDSNTAKPLQGYFEARDIAAGELLVLSEPERIECYIALAVNRSGTCVAIRISDGTFLDTLSNRDCGLVYKRWQLYLETESGRVLVWDHRN